MDGGGAEILMEQKDLRNQREGALENETLGSRFSALKGLDNLELKDDARDKMISGDDAAKLRGNEKMVARNSGKETDSRLDGLLGKMNAIMGQNRDGGGPSFPTNGASLNGQMAGQRWQSKRRNGGGLRWKLLDLEKHLMVVFKETSNLDKGEVPRVGGDDGVRKEVPTSKVRGSSDKGGTSRSGRKLNQTIQNCRGSFKLVGTVHVPLSDFISSLVELINTHLDMKNSK
ncbi:hypothetical protein PVK06_001153 [Gossypium arboreum]|uniref:Uncharacterized protein n=1 Tax=Gossypium arboreum TaxID=29729 RepID=A0ABR0R1J5_GOSAR|nr:hypothetical protein PVK06_001153 [Gossypium arboreum]